MEERNKKMQKRKKKVAGYIKRYGAMGVRVD